MILEEKALLNPPPPYQFSGSNPDVETSSPITVGSSNPYAAYLSARRPVKFNPSLSSLPSHLLLQIVYCTFPQEAGQFEGDAKEVLQRRTLHWLETSLRLVNHNLYIACMHILRSTYLPWYDSLIRPPYSSDPFPTSYSIPAYRPLSSRRNSPYGSSSSLFPQHRELRTLDLFISVLAHEELLYDTSDLYLSRYEAYKDIFDLRQPRSRMEDLVAEEGAKAGLITIADEDSVPGTPTTPQTPSEPVGKENSPYSMGSSLVASPRTSTSTFSHPLKKSKSTLSMFSFRRKGKGKELEQQPLPQPIKRKAELSPLPFRSLTVSFSTRKVGLVYAPVPSCTSSRSSLTVTGSSSSAYGGSTYGALGVSYNSLGRKRTIVEVQRDKDEALEVSARRLVRGLREWMEEENQSYQ
ncbi:hypothetical protein F5890DRAFT_1181177 [Lentinula detonsa]|uniref:Uncharacterized protein n=1 Tax=Lentinula detonsa TaxID=2804962 RepID=A0AA38Q1G9_9AGAR|nr:hypothetical protein F5890DRAFT_1181177 [Lentinula detonsa]